VGGVIQAASLVAGGVLFMVGIYAVVFKDNLIKKVMGLTFIGDAVNLILIAMDYKEGGIVPIILPGMNPEVFASQAAYPLTIALVLTNIVIAVATISLILGLCIKIYGKKGTLSSRRVWQDEQ
jgi:energy-converting hydrogenase B subunit E